MRRESCCPAEYYAKSKIRHGSLFIFFGIWFVIVYPLVLLSTRTVIKHLKGITSRTLHSRSEIAGMF